MSAIIECPACKTRYKMGKPIPEGGRNVKCARCGHQWRLLPEQPPEEAGSFGFAPIAHDGPSPAPSHAHSEASAEHEEPTAAERRSWDIRRGNYEAAMASLGEPPSEDAPAETQPASENPVFSQTPSWLSDNDAFSARHAEEDASPTESADIAASRSDTSPSASRWDDDSTWMNQQTGDALQDAGEADPEDYVRRALKAALEESDEEDGKTASPSDRFGHARYAETFTGAFTDQETADSGAEESTFRLASEETAETGTSLQSEDRFENDIAGIFRQDGQPKRGFARPETMRREDGGFTDYDAQPGGLSGRAGPMDTSDPLDADAAALQAVLEGSLRERHAEETRSGGAGGLALAAAWAVFLSVLSGVTLALVTFRDEMVTALPGTAALYRSVGLSVQDRQIDFGPVSYRWTLSDGKPMIEVTGQVINLTDHEITVPRVLVNVRDAESSDPVKAVATLRSEPLAARETADFTLEFLAPPKSVTQIELAFADD